MNENGPQKIVSELQDYLADVLLDGTHVLWTLVGELPNKPGMPWPRDRRRNWMRMFNAALDWYYPTTEEDRFLGYLARAAESPEETDKFIELTKGRWWLGESGEFKCPGHEHPLPEGEGTDIAHKQEEPTLEDVRSWVASLEAETDPELRQQWAHAIDTEIGYARPIENTFDLPAKPESSLTTYRDRQKAPKPVDERRRIPVAHAIHELGGTADVSQLRDKLFGTPPFSSLSTLGSLATSVHHVLRAFPDTFVTTGVNDSLWAVRPELTAERGDR